MLQKLDARTKALLDLADVMDTLAPDEYDQLTFDNGCRGGCIAYWACRQTGSDDFNEARHALHIDIDTAKMLFAPEAGSVYMMGCRLRGPTPQEAASALRHLATTGTLPKRW